MLRERIEKALRDQSVEDPVGLTRFGFLILKEMGRY